jgi:uncharacterized phage protein (TIGR02216 family)
VLRLSPNAFWRMTPRELAFALRAIAPPVTEPLARDAFVQLMRRHPDRPGTAPTHRNGADHGG